MPARLRATGVQREMAAAATPERRRPGALAMHMVRIAMLRDPPRPRAARAVSSRSSGDVAAVMDLPFWGAG